MTTHTAAWTQRRVAIRDLDADETRFRALVAIDGDPGTYEGRWELPERFIADEFKALRAINVVTLADGRKGLEGDR